MTDRSTDDDSFDDAEPLAPEARRPVMIGIAYLALLLIAGLGVLLVAGGLIRW